MFSLWLWEVIPNLNLDVQNIEDEDHRKFRLVGSKQVMLSFSLSPLSLSLSLSCSLFLGLPHSLTLLISHLFRNTLCHSTHSLSLSLCLLSLSLSLSVSFWPLLILEDDIPPTQPDAFLASPKQLAPVVGPVPEISAQELQEIEVATESEAAKSDFITRDDQNTTFPDTKKGNRGQHRAKGGKKKTASEPKTKPKKRPAAKPTAVEEDARPKKRGRKPKVAPEAEASTKEDKKPAGDEGDDPNEGPAQPPQPKAKAKATPKGKAKAKATAAKTKPGPPAPPPGPNPAARPAVRQDWNYSQMVVYWTRNSVGLKIRATGSQAELLNQ